MSLQSANDFDGLSGRVDDRPSERLRLAVPGGVREIGRELTCQRTRRGSGRVGGETVFIVDGWCGVARPMFVHGE